MCDILTFLADAYELLEVLEQQLALFLALSDVIATIR